MKKQVIETIQFVCKDHAVMYFTDGKIDITGLSERQIKDGAYCSCGKHCKPVKLSISVNPVEDNELKGSEG